MHDVLLVAHVLAGTLGLLLGPAALLAPRTVRASLAGAYQVAVTAVAVTAVGLVAIAPDLWWLLPVAAATQAGAFVGSRVHRWDWTGWPTWQAHLLGGSYVALVTGLAVASTGLLVFWLLPALVAQLPIAVAKRRLAVGPAAATPR